jgi:hypothetical protein
MSRFGKLVERKKNILGLKRWTKLAANASSLSLEELRQLRVQARGLFHKLDAFLYAADARLALPRIGSNAMQLPALTEWSHRPEMWRAAIAPRGAVAISTRFTIGHEATAFHDCTTSEVSFQQVRNTSVGDLAPFGLMFDVFQFDGTFLSLSVDMSADACEGLSSRSILRFDCDLYSERDVKVFVRLNVQHGPNHEQMLYELDTAQDGMFTEFDIAYLPLIEQRLEKVWVDLIFENPAMNKIIVRDFALSRRPRAEL